MEPGKLRHRVTIEALSEAQSGQGDITETWATGTTVWGSVEPLTGRELLNAQVVYSDVTHRVRLRFKSGLSTRGHRLKHRTRILHIGSIIDPTELNEQLELLCMERVS